MKFFKRSYEGDMKECQQVVQTIKIEIDNNNDLHNKILFLLIGATI